jgi:hypothetical protein
MTAHSNGQPITADTRVSLSTRDWLGIIAVFIGMLVTIIGAVVGLVLYQERRDAKQDANIRDVETQIGPLKGEVLPDLKRDIRDLSQSTAALRDAVTRLQAQNERR